MNKENAAETGLEIAVIGMACRFPGAKHIEEYWDKLKKGIECTVFLSDEELEKEKVTSLQFNGPNYVKACVQLENKGNFDSAFFGYTPPEAEIMDPQMRLSHECCWEALEDAGYDPFSYNRLIGLYIGSTNSFNWQARAVISGKGGAFGGFLAKLLTDDNMMSTRISYKLDLKGPAVNVFTTCSTSLTTVHLACRALLTGECDMALAGGVSASTYEKTGYTFQEGTVISPDGHCRAFDARANGTIFGEGVGIVVLKRLTEAKEEKDHIYALVKGSAVNNDGMDKVSYTAPGKKGQQEVIRCAIQIANVPPESITFIETHGTGTHLGDPIEIEALKGAFNTDKKKFCAIGSVKTNFGHLDTAAGIAGFIKTVLALTHKRIPPTLHFEIPNPNIDFDKSPFYVNVGLCPWENHTYPLRAGVSSFGMGGTNVHMVLEEWPHHSSNAWRTAHGAEYRGGPLHPPPDLQKYQLILLSAKTETALDKMTKNLAEYLKKNLLNHGNQKNPVNPGPTLADAAYTLQVGRKAFKYRKMLVSHGVHELIEALSSPNPGVIETFCPEDINMPLVFMFPGQGAQYVDMGLELYNTEPVFREEMDRCFEILKPLMNDDIKEILYPTHPAPSGHPSQEGSKGGSPCPPRDNVESTGQDSRSNRSGLNRSNRSHPSYKTYQSHIHQTEITQPIIFTFEYALAKLLIYWGITPRAMIGHSIGEYTAAHLAGVLSLTDALKMVVLRGQLMQQLPPGAMLSVPLPEEELNSLLDEEVQIAAVNGPNLCVVSGIHEAIEALEKELAQKDIDSTRLHTSHAFHSKMMDPILTEFETKINQGQFQFSPPGIPYISNVTGKWIKPEEATDPRYWKLHLRKTVRFGDGLRELLDQEEPIFVEVGPGRVLSTFIKKGVAPPTYNCIGNGSKQGNDKKACFFEDISKKQFSKNTGEEYLTVNLVKHPHQQIPDDIFLLGKIGQLWLYGQSPDWEKFHRGEKRQRISLPTYPFEENKYWIELDGAGISPGIPAEDPSLRKKPDIADWFYIPTWKRSHLRLPKSPVKISGRCCLLLEDTNNNHLGSRLKERLEEEGMEVLQIRAGTETNDYHAKIDELKLKGKVPHTIVHMWNLTGNDPAHHELEPGNIEKTMESAYYSLLSLARTIGSHYSRENIQILVISDQMQEVLGEPVLSPGKAVLLGPVTVIPKEYPNITCTSIDIVFPGPGTIEEEKMLKQLTTEIKAGTTSAIIAYRHCIRWVREYESFPLEGAGESHPRLRDRGTYMITGGLGGIGLTLAEYLARQVKAKLILIGRSAFPLPGDWEQWFETHPPGDIISGKIEKIRQMETWGAEVLVLSVDVSNRQHLQQALEKAEQEFGPINGVIHAAGVPDAGLIQATRREDREQVFASKVLGTVSLDSILGDRKLDFFILCSSLASILSPLGQVAYTSANAFLDAYACYKRMKYSTPVTSINWDVWQEVGMAVAAGKQFEEAPGILLENGILPVEGREIFTRVVGEPLPQVIISTGNLARRIEESAREGIEYSPVQGKETLSLPKQKRPRLKTRYTSPGNELEKNITRVWQDLLGIEPVGIDDNFFDLGATSLDILRVNRKLKEILRKNLPIVALYNYPTVAQLVKHLSRDETHSSPTNEEDILRGEARKGKNTLRQRGKRVEE